MTPLDPEAAKRAGDVCKRCRAEILWATTAAKPDGRPGKPIPIDPEPVYGGNIMLDVDEVGLLKARVVRPAGDIEGYVAHFVSCPAAEEFRRTDAPPPAGHEEQLDAKRDALQRVMPFGKFVGQTLEEIDRDGRGHSYLKWAYEKLSFREPALKRAIGIVVGEEEP